jgi:phage terminase large subunit-like protein
MDAKQYGGTTEVENLTLNFNIWMSSASSFISADVWNKNQHGLTVEDGEECYGGLEISTESGYLSSFCLLFPGDVVKVKMLFFIEDEALKTNDLYRQHKDFIRFDPGNVVDNDIAEEWIVAEIQKYNMHSFCFPKPQEKNSIVQGLIKRGYQGNPISQGINGIANATDEYEKLVRSGSMEHFGNPILRWQNSNCMAVRKEAGTRLEKNGKVLGIWACIDAVAQWKTIAAEGGSEVGIVFI